MIEFQQVNAKNLPHHKQTLRNPSTRRNFLQKNGLSAPGNQPERKIKETFCDTQRMEIIQKKM
jgi:hypothetical protein